MKKSYKVELSENERAELEQLLRSGEHNTHELRRARTLLKAAAGWNDTKIAQAFEINERTALRTRQRFNKGGLKLALYDLPRTGAPVKLAAKLQAVVIATACSPAPEGRKHWTLRLLSERLVELELVENIAPNTVKAVLKKTNLNLTSSNNGVSPTR